MGEMALWLNRTHWEQSKLGGSQEGCNTILPSDYESLKIMDTLDN